MKITFLKSKYQSLLTKITFTFIEESSNGNIYSCNHMTIYIDHNKNRALTVQILFDSVTSLMIQHFESLVMQVAKGWSCFILVSMTKGVTPAKTRCNVTYQKKKNISNVWIYLFFIPFSLISSNLKSCN